MNPGTPTKSPGGSSNRGWRALMWFVTLAALVAAAIPLFPAPANGRSAQAPVLNHASASSSVGAAAIDHSVVERREPALDPESIGSSVAAYDR